MSLKNAIAALFRAEDPAVTAHGLLLKRLEALEEAVNELADGQEDVISKVRSWSAREAAKKRHEASRNLDEIMAANGSSSDENVDPGASESHEDQTMRRIADERAARKAEIARRFRRA